MKYLLSLLLAIALPTSLLSQAKMDRILKKFNKESVPYITVDALHDLNTALTLDARRREEYEVSHLKDAVWVGHKTFEVDSVLSKIKNRDSEIVVYCSIGVRSENIGEKLREAGYTNIKNLYGGIFEWKNKGYPVYDSQEQKTEKVHAFNKHWGKLLKIGDKVYDTP